MNIFHMCAYKSLVFGIENIEIIFDSDYHVKKLSCINVNLSFLYWLYIYTYSIRKYVIESIDNTSVESLYEPRLVEKSMI